MEPIEKWRKLISSDLTEDELLKELQQVYRANPPYVAEIIMNSYCPNRCLHCIYPPDFHLYNRNMDLEEWKKAFEIIYEQLGLRRFVFDGRGLSQDCLEAVRFIRQNFEEVKIGLITDGISARPFKEDLMTLPLDWIDISIDGLEQDHDAQRNRKGAFTKALDLLIELKDSGQFEKVNVLTCLTTINIGTVLDMIELLNREGFKNFFITPISIMEGYRPDPRLKVSDEEFVRFIENLMTKAKYLSDTWVELGIYETGYAHAIERLAPNLFCQFIMDYDHLEVVKNYDDNEVHICYYPSSLTGVREFIINSDGTVIPPRVMAMGRIPNDLSFGNIMEATEETLRNLCDKDGFFFYHSELMEESFFLGGQICSPSLNVVRR